MAIAPASGPAVRRDAHAARSLFWLLAAAICFVPLHAFWAMPIPPAVVLVLLLTAALGFWRPFDALLVIASLVPVAGAIHVISGAPYDALALVEIVVLAVLGVGAMRACVRGSPLNVTAFDLAALAFGCIAAASCAALLPTAVLRAGSDDWVSAVGTLISRDYFLRPEALKVVERTAIVLEGLALAVAVRRLATGPHDALRLAHMMILGGTAAATLNLVRLLEVASRQPHVLASLADALQTVRFNTQFGDLNAAGSYFAMVAVLAACQWGMGSSPWWARLAVVPLLAGGLWVSGSRVALAVSVLTVAAAMALARYGTAWRRRMPPLVLPVAAGSLLVAGALLVYLLPLTRHGSFHYSVATRLGLLEVGGRMVAERPLLGIGITQFYEQFPRYVSRELSATFEEALGYAVPRENAHNQFVQVLAELGIAGLASFVAVLVVALSRQSRVGSRPAGVAAALAAFLVTGLAGHPLLTPLVAASFWIMTGLAAAGARPVSTPTVRTLAWCTAALVGVLVVSMPARWRLERRDADLAGASLGLSAWQRDETGTRFQSAVGRAALFVSGASPLVRIPLRSPDSAWRRVQVFLDGQLAAVVRVPTDRWTDVDLPLRTGPAVPRYRRVDVHVESSEAPNGGRAAGTLMVGRVVEEVRP